MSSYYNSDLDAFTLNHQHNEHEQHDLHALHHPPPRQHHHGLHLPHLPHLPHPHLPHLPNLSDLAPSHETIHEVALPTLGQAVTGSIGSAIAHLAVYPLDVVVKRLQVQRALSRRPETKRERDRRIERERLELAKEEDLLAFSLSGDEEEKERERLRRKWKKERERKERKEKGMGMLFEDPVVVNGDRQPPLDRYAAEDRHGRGAAKLRVDTTSTTGGRVGGAYGVGGLMTGGGLEEKVRIQLLDDRARGKVANSDYDTTTHDEPDSRGRDRPVNGVVNEDSEFNKRRPRFKPMDGYEELEGYYEEGDEVEYDENYKGVADAFEKIFEKEGVRGFYTGVVEDTVNTTMNGLWYFATYSFLRHQRLKHLPPNTTSLPVFEEVSVGILAGAISKFFTTPIANVVTRKQTAALHTREHKCEHNHDPDRKNRHGEWCAHKHKSRRPTAVSIIQDIYEEKGASGFWAGYKPSMLLTLNPAITFLLYELLKRGLPKNHRSHQTKTQTFFMGALAKAFASTVTYPLAVVKTRSMIKSREEMELTVKRKKKKNASTDSSSGGGGGSSVSDSYSSSSEQESVDSGIKKYKLKYKNKYKKRYGKLKHGRGEHNASMTAVAKEIYKTEGLRGFYVGLWAEVIKGFFANGISMLIKETIFHTLTSMYLLVLRARNRTDDKTFTGTLVAIGHEIHESLNSKHQHLVDRADGVKRDAEDLLERGKERWHLGREKIVRGVTGGAGGAVGGGVYRNNVVPEEGVISKTTTTTVMEEIRQPLLNGNRDLNGNANSTVNIDVTRGITPPHPRHERSNSTGADLIKRKLQLRDAGRDRIHEGTIHDGTHKLGGGGGGGGGVHNRNHSTIDRTIITNTTTVTAPAPLAPIISGVAAADKSAIPSIPARDRVATWLEHTEKENLGLGLGPGPGAGAAPIPPPATPMHEPPLVSVKHPAGMPALLQRAPANTPFTPHVKAGFLEGQALHHGHGHGQGNGGGVRTGTFDVSKSRNIMREVVNESNGTRIEKEVVSDRVDWEEDDRDWMRRR